MNILQLLAAIDKAFEEHVDDGSPLEQLRTEVRGLIQDFNDEVLYAVKKLDEALSR